MLLFALVLGMFVGCTTARPPTALKRFHYTSPHMGTVFRITLYAESAEHAEPSAQAAFSRVAQLEDALSDYIADSELSRLSKAPANKPIPVSADLFHVLEQAAIFSSLTGGAFDITAGPYTRLWRFSRKRQTLPPADDLAHARACVGWTNIALDALDRSATLRIDGMRLDPGGIAKGYAADEALKCLQAHGIESALIAAGGDIRAGNPPPGKKGWTVEVRGPRSDSGHAEPATSRSSSQRRLLRNGAISTSGDTEQFVEIEGVRYSHVVSPWTGLGLTNRVQATVIAPDATTSDALATACCILGPERAVVLIDTLPNVGVILDVATSERHRRWESKHVR